MNTQISKYITTTFQVAFLGLTLLLPFLFWNITSEFYETPKFVVLAVATLLLLALWVVKFVVSGKVTITRTPLDLPFLLLLVVFIVSTFFSSSQPNAILGHLPKIHDGLASFIIYILFYFVLVSNLKSISLVKQIVYLLIASGVILAIQSILSYFGLHLLPINFTQSVNFTPTGSNFSTNAILIMLLPFLLYSILHHSKDDLLGNSLGSFLGSAEGIITLVKSGIYTALLSIFTISLALTGSWLILLAAALSFGLTLVTVPQNTLKKNLPFIALPVVLAALILFASYLPLAGAKNPLYQRAQNFPKELQLPFSISWKISVSTFRDSPFWGSGPASYLTDFTTYKPVEFNSTKFWNVRFDTAFNEYLHFLATLGSTGFIALLLLTVAFLSKAIKTLFSSAERNPLSMPLTISGMIFFVLLALHASTLIVWAVGIIILAAFMIVHRGTAEDLQIGIAATPTHAASSEDGLKYIRFDVLPTLLLLITFIGVGAAFFFGSRYFLADYYHRAALNAVSQGKGLEAYNFLVKSEGLNPYTDLYRTDLAQTNFALANAIASAKGPSESSPAGSLTDQDKQNIQTLLSQSINEGRAATTLNPNNPANWEILASIYRQISGVAQNALSFSLDSYGRAIQKDPLNPILRLSVGGIYYSIKNYDLAIRFFTDAINLKPDYANAYFNLAIVLKDKGDFSSAVAVAEKTISLLDPKSTDYQTASQLLADLKAKTATPAAEEQIAPTPTPKAKTSKDSPEAKLQSEADKSSALQDKSLPKVLDLPQAENIATPPAVKKTQE